MGWKDEEIWNQILEFNLSRQGIKSLCVIEFHTRFSNFQNLLLPPRNKHFLDLYLHGLNNILLLNFLMGLWAKLKRDCVLGIPQHHQLLCVNPEVHNPFRPFLACQSFVRHQYHSWNTIWYIHCIFNCMTGSWINFRLKSVVSSINFKHPFSVMMAIF
jgi:hypothetical protein